MINLHLDVDITSLPLNDARKKIDSINQVAEHFCLIQLYDECMYCCENALDMSEKISYRKGIAGVKHVLGMYRYKRNEYALSIPLFEEAANIYNSLALYKNEGMAYKELGISCWHAGDYKTQIDSFFKALHIFRKESDEKLESDVLNCIGNYYLVVTEYPLALEYYSMGLKISRRLKNVSVCIMILYNMACAHYNMSANDKALNCFRAALDLNERIERNTYFENRINNTMSVIYTLKGEYETANTMLERCLDYFIKMNYNMDRCDTLINIAKNYSEMKKLDLAEKTFYEAFDFAGEIKNKSMMMNAAREISKFYSNARNFKDSLSFFKKFTEMEFEKNKTLQENNIRKLNILHTVELTKKETKALSQKNEDLKLLNSQLKTLNSEKNYFLNLAANDLKVLLENITDKINLIKNGEKNEQAKNLSEILIESSYMQKVISDLLSINETESSKVKLI